VGTIKKTMRREIGLILGLVIAITLGKQAGGNCSNHAWLIRHAELEYHLSSYTNTVTFELHILIQRVLRSNSKTIFGNVCVSNSVEDKQLFTCIFHLRKTTSSILDEKHTWKKLYSFFYVTTFTHVTWKMYFVVICLVLFCLSIVDLTVELPLQSSSQALIQHSRRGKCKFTFNLHLSGLMIWIGSDPDPDVWGRIQFLVLTNDIISTFLA
jgi:hypothetical protein